MPEFLPDSAATQLQMRGILERKIGGLPEILRVVLVLRSVEELSVHETAESLGISEETVRSRHFRAKAMLRESLAREIDVAEGNIYEFGGNRCDSRRRRSVGSHRPRGSGASRPQVDGTLTLRAATTD